MKLNRKVNKKKKRRSRKGKRNENENEVICHMFECQLWPTFHLSLNFCKHFEVF